MNISFNIAEYESLNIYRAKPKKIISQKFPTNWNVLHVARELLRIRAKLPTFCLCIPNFSRAFQSFGSLLLLALLLSAAMEMIEISSNDFPFSVYRLAL